GFITVCFFFSSRRRHTRFSRDWSSDVCSSDLGGEGGVERQVTDPSGLPPVPDGGPGVFPIHAASGVGYGEGFAANIHRHVPDGRSEERRVGKESRARGARAQCAQT